MTKLLSAVLMLLVTAHAHAAEKGSPAIDATELERLVATIEDPTKRGELVSQLKALLEAQRAAAAPAEPSISSAGALALQAISAKVSALTEQLATTAQSLMDAPRLITGFLSGQLTQEQGWRQFWLTMLSKVLLVLATGFVAELFARRLLASSMAKLGASRGEHLIARLPSAVAHLLLDLARIVAFAVAAYGALAFLEPRETTRLVALALVNAAVIVRVVLAVVRSLLAPNAPALRLLPIGDETSNYWIIWARRATGTAVFGYFTAEMLLLLGIASSLHELVLDLLAFVLTIIALIIVFQNRRDVAARIRGDTSIRSPLAVLRRRIADMWHLLASAYICGVFVVWLIHLPGGFEFVARATALSLLIVVVAGSLAAALRGAIVRLTRLKPETSMRFPGLEARANRYLPIVNTAISILVFAVAVPAILASWNIDALAWMDSEAGQAVGRTLASIAFILIAAVIVWELVSASIERYLSDPDGVGRSARVKTLLPLARNALLVILSVIVVLTVLSELGINIGPLLAGAGVLGLAIGFGAQTLVKDIITGVFILMEDIISIGNFVEVGSHAGTAEGMSIRTLRLRDPAGNLHTVPFSDVASVLTK